MVTVVGGTLPNLIDLAKTHGQFGQTLPVVNTLSKATFFSKAYWEQANLPQGQLSVRTTGKPTSTVRRVNQAVAPSKSTHTQITEQMCEFANFAKVDDSTLNGFDDKMAERARLIKQHPTVLGEDFEETVIYGASGNGTGEFDGFFSRAELTAIGDQCLDAGGTGGGSVYASILLVYWGTDTCKIVYPKGTLAGVKHKDFGLSMTAGETGADGSELPMWKDWFSLSAGLSIPNPQSVVRIANILASDVLGVTGTQQLTDYTSNIVYRTAEAMDRVPEAVKAVGRPMWIVPRSVKSGINLQVLAHTFANVFSRGQMDDAGRMRPDTWYGIPMYTSDLMGYAEAEVN